MRRSRSRLGGLRRTGGGGCFLLAGAAAATRATLGVAGAVLGWGFGLGLAEVAALADFEEALTGARFRGAGRRAERAFAEPGRRARATRFFAVLALFAPVLRFAAVRFRLAAFLAAGRLRPAVFRLPAFLAPAADRRRVARAAFRLAMRGPFRGVLTLTVSR
jgi:hypothetical protein